MNIRKFVLSVVLAAGCFAVAVPSTQAQPTTSQLSAPVILPAALHGLMSGGIRVTVLDVREPEEFSQGHIQGAVLIPLGTLPQKYTTIPKSGKLVVYCRTGHRSAEAVQFLRAHGYSNAVSLSGGYTAWAKAQY